MSRQSDFRALPGTVAQFSFSGDFGGREKVALGLFHSLREVGQKCLLYVVVEERAGKKRNKNLMQSLGDIGPQVQIFTTRSRFSPALLFRLARSFNKENVCVVHCHCYKALFYSVLMRFLGLLDAVVTYTLHGLILPKGIRASLIRISQTMGMYMIDGVIGCSHEILVSSFPKPKKVRTISIINAVKLPEDDFATLQASKFLAQAELVRRYRLDPAGLVVINVGRLCPQKNYPLFLEMVRQGLELEPASKTNFLIVGNGELQVELETLAAQFGVQRHVVFTGFVSDMDLIYRGADLLIQTSVWEGTPMCLLEARAYGLPVVAPAVGGNVDVVESGNDGFLYPVDDVDALMKHYVTYVTNAELRHRHGQAAFQQIGSKFGTRDWALRHMDFYENLTACENDQ